MLAVRAGTDPDALTRLLQLVTDPDRHDRLRATTGGDTAALAETTATIQLLTTNPGDPKLLELWRPGVCTHPDPDLESLAEVVWHRDRLHHRNRNIPTALPAVWAPSAIPAAPKTSPTPSPTTTGG
jgi:hypothetical protein